MTTPSQTVGPYLAIGMPWADGPDVVPEGTPGRIRLYGDQQRLLDSRAIFGALDGVLAALRQRTEYV